MPAERPVAILFVCTGNICRSPTAEGVARAWVQRLGLENRVFVDSAGTHGYHVGEAPDPRTQAFALNRGYDLSPLRARRVCDEDFARFDLLLAMDRSHLGTLLRAAPAVYRPRVQLFLGHGRHEPEAEVEDPYYGGDAGFERVLDQCEHGVQALLRDLGFGSPGQDIPPRRPRRGPGL